MNSQAKTELFGPAKNGSLLLTWSHAILLFDVAQLMAGPKGPAARLSPCMKELAAPASAVAG